MLLSDPLASVSTSRIERIVLAPGEIRRIVADGTGIALLVLAGATRIEDRRTAWVAPAGHAVTVPSGHALRLMAGRGSILGIIPIDQPSSAEPWLVRISPLSIAIGLHDDIAADDAHIRAVLLREIGRAERVRHGIRLPRDPRARLIAQTIIRDPTDTRSLMDFAEQSGMSRRTLLRLFVAETGLSFRDFRRHAKIHRSLAMMAEGAAIQDAALGAGYESTPAFIAAFRAVIGCTPGRHLREMAAIATI